MRKSEWDWQEYEMADRKVRREISELQSKYLISQEQLRVVLKYAVSHRDISLEAAYQFMYGQS